MSARPIEATPYLAGHGDPAHCTTRRIKYQGQTAMPKTKKYRILFSVAMFSGNATYYKNLHDIVSEMEDVEPTWLPIEWAPREWFAHIPPVSMNWSVKGGLVTRHRVLALERSGLRFDAALFHHQMLPIWLFDFRKRVPTVITTDATPVLHDKYAAWYEKKLLTTHPLVLKLKKRLTRSVFADAHCVLPFSDWVKRSLINDYQVPDERITVIPPGINLSFWHNGTRSADASKPVRILFVGGQFLRKGGDILARTARRPAFRNCRFDVVTQTVPAGMPENVTVHTNVEPNSMEMLGLYSKADVFVLPTRADFHSWVSLEAMAMQLPVITTDVGAMSEIVEDGASGFIIPVDDEDAFAARLEELASNAAMRRQFGARGRTIVEKKFDLRVNIEQTILYLKQAADARLNTMHRNNGATR
jgi:glycosyltransferase involved in cell wall biosynthesis